jgi:hypothetical protein
MMSKLQSGQINLLLVLAIFFGVGTLLFGTLAVLAYSQRNDAVNNLNQHVNDAVSKATSDQKKEDEEANRKLNELPYRTYTATPGDGSFQLQIPKNWSIYAEHTPVGVSSTQLTLVASQDVVNVTKNGHDTQPFMMQLVNKSAVDIVKSFNDKIKTKKLGTKTISVSGISSTYLEGVLDDERHDGIEVIVPVRDKAMVFITQSHSFVPEFNQILANAKIIP